jgi:multidrug transporter EmrE-like cation transporter
MIKIILVFLIGFIEQLLYTAYLLSVNKKQVNTSSILMISYMVIYLFIITYAIKDANTIPLLIAYAIACGMGNYLVMLWETWEIKYRYIYDDEILDKNKIITIYDYKGFSVQFNHICFEINKKSK